MALSQTKTFSFDLDDDGEEDKLICRYWARWGDFVCNIDLSKFGLLEHSWGVDQLGIAETTTNGVHDLVVDWVKTLVYDGAVYRKKHM